MHSNPIHQKTELLKETDKDAELQVLKMTKEKGVASHLILQPYWCRAMMTKGMVFRYTWVYSKEDTKAHTCRLMVTS